MSLRERLNDLAKFAELGGWTWSEPSDATFAFISGDPNDYCFEEGGSYTVRKEERGAFSRPLIVAERIEEIEKFLSFRYGSDVREHQNLPAIDLNWEPISIGDEQRGFRFSGELGNVRVAWREGDRERSVSGLGRFAAAEFAVYAQYDAEAIRQSFLREDGHPLFTAHE